jgi:hypothetical protein
MVKFPILLLLAVCLYGQSTPPPPAEPPANLPDAPVVKPQVPVDLDKPADKRVAGVLPNYRTANPYSVYHPLTSKQKMIIATKDSFDYPLYALGGAFAALDQLTNSDPSYGQGTKGFAERYAADYGDQMIGNMMTEGIFPVILHQDPRYFRLGVGSVKKRTWYALTRIFVAHDDNGKLDFNYSEWLGNATGVAISQSYHFDDRNAHSATDKLIEQCGVDAVSQVLKEFWPDVKRKYFNKKNPSTPPATASPTTAP